MTQSIEACVLCGSETGDRVMALVEWLEPIGNVHWSHVPRCVDRVGCRERVEVVLREPWPINDRTPAPSGLAVAYGPQPGLREEPLPAPEPPAPHVQEDEIAWLK